MNEARNVCSRRIHVSSVFVADPDDGGHAAAGAGGGDVRSLANIEITVQFLLFASRLPFP